MRYPSLFARTSSKPKVRKFSELSLAQEDLWQCKRFNCIAAPCSDAEALNYFSEGKHLIGSLFTTTKLAERKCCIISKKEMIMNYAPCERWSDYLNEVHLRMFNNPMINGHRFKMHFWVILK